MKAKFWKIKSDSEKDKEYTVRLVNGEWRCDCADFIFREKQKGICKHVSKIITV